MDGTESTKTKSVEVFLLYCTSGALLHINYLIYYYYYYYNYYNNFVAPQHKATGMKIKLVLNNCMVEMTPLVFRKRVKK